MKSHKIKMEIPAHINPRYDLDPDEIATREAMLLTELSTISPYPDIYCVWIQPDIDNCLQSQSLIGPILE